MNLTIELDTKGKGDTEDKRKSNNVEIKGFLPFWGFEVPFWPLFFSNRTEP